MRAEAMSTPEQTTLFTIPAAMGVSIEIRARFNAARRKYGDLYAAQTYPEHPEAGAILARYASDPAPLELQP